MLPLGHIALAYLSYVGYAFLTTRRLPAGVALVSVVFGSQFPDLVDKPLAYWNVLTYGRSLAHSVFTFVLVSGFVWWAVQYLETRWKMTENESYLRFISPAAFAVGYVSHLLGDAYKPVLRGEYYEARFLLYPLYSLPESPADDIAPWVRMLHFYRNMDIHPQVELILLALVIFVVARIRTSRTEPV